MLMQNILLLQRRVEKDIIKKLKEKMKKDLQKEREIRKRELQNSMVRFPTHTTNM